MMSGPPDSDETESPKPNRPGLPTADEGPFPSPRHAFFLSLWAFLASGFLSIFFLDLGPVAAIGIGQTLAVGLIATLAARRVAEPQAERMGLRSFDPRALPLVLCLVPATLLISELDNFAQDFSGESQSAVESASYNRDAAEFETQTYESTPLESSADGDGVATSQGGTDSEGSAPAGPASKAESEATAATTESADDLPDLAIDLDDPWTIAQAFVISVGMTPVVEEFFFRGVLQQGLIARLGLHRGVGFVAILYTLPHLPAVASVPRFLMGTLTAFGMGYLLGLVRVATGSILASIILSSLSAAVAIFSFMLRDRFPLPGMNVDGTHLPVVVTIASLCVVGWAANTVHQVAKQRFKQERFGVAKPELSPPPDQVFDDS